MVDPQLECCWKVRIRDASPSALPSVGTGRIGRSRAPGAAPAAVLEFDIDAKGLKCAGFALVLEL